MDLHYIVDQLNAPPFQYNLSLLSLRCSSSNRATDIRHGVSLNVVIHIHAQREVVARMSPTVVGRFRSNQPETKGRLPNFALPWVL